MLWLVALIAQAFMHFLYLNNFNGSLTTGLMARASRCICLSLLLPPQEIKKNYGWLTRLDGMVFPLPRHLGLCKLLLLLLAGASHYYTGRSCKVDHS